RRAETSETNRDCSCTRRDLNPHALRRRNLNPVRLPIPPLVRGRGAYRRGSCSSMSTARWMATSPAPGPFAPDGSRRPLVCLRDHQRSAPTMSHSDSDFDPEYVFSHHHATPEQLAHFDAIHTGAKRFAEVLIDHVPACLDRAAALRLLRESTMLACAA